MSMLLQHAVDEAFERMSKVYGREFVGKFDGDIADVKVQWMRELGGVSLDAIASALRNLPERSPNAIGFRNLCRQQPSPQQVAMQASPEPTRGPTPAEVIALAALRTTMQTKRANKQWAFDLVGRYEAGDRRMSAYALKKAREVVDEDRRLPILDPEDRWQAPPMPAAPAPQPHAEAFDDFYEDGSRL